MKKILSWILLSAMLVTFLGGCSGTKSGNETEQKSSTKKEETADQSGDEALKDGEIAMGRYVEEATDLSDRLSGYGNHLFALSDGTLVIIDEYAPSLISEDGGETWTVWEQDWLSKLEGDPYIMDVKVGKDGTVYVVYDADEDEDNIKGELMILYPDGAQKNVQVPTSEEEHYINQVWVSEDNRVFATTFGRTIYEIKEDGTSEPFLFLDGNGLPQQIQLQGNYMLIDGHGSNYSSILIYDLEKKTFLEDPVLAEFVSENYSDRDTNGGSWFDLYFFFGEDQVLYLAGEKGLYRHVIGGSVMEQVVDGSLSVFNNPSYSLVGMLALENKEFLALFQGGQMVRYVYDPDTPTVPTERLKVYSLEENSLLRQAITLYQSENPDVFVEYEVGRDQDGAITREDAIKSLNTKIMAGNGPDFLILDGLPVKSYMEKGLLKDLSPILNSLEGEEAVFTNFTDAFLSDGKISVIPCEIALPALAGGEKYLSGAKDLSGLAAAVEQMRKDHPGDCLVDTINPKGVLKWFSMTCAPAWEKENGAVDYDALSEFLTQAKRIYDAQMDGLDSKYMERFEEINRYSLAERGQEREDLSYFREIMDELSIIGKGQTLLCGTISYAYSYSSLNSISRVKGFEDTKVLPMPGQGGSVFYAKTLAGINASSENTERAEAFFRLMIGKENQATTYQGFPINRAAFEQSFVIKEGEIDAEGIYGSVASSYGDEEIVSMDIYWADQEQINTLQKWMESRTVPYIENERLENAVYQEGTEFLKGSKSLEEALAGIEERVSLYMAE